MGGIRIRGSVRFSGRVIVSVMCMLLLELGFNLSLRLLLLLDLQLELWMVRVRFSVIFSVNLRKVLVLW